ncbi:MAG: Gfo/Idh/MocA family protein [Planctomycetota bacterium]
MSDVMTVGVIGCGGIAGKHIRRFIDRSDTRVIALMDPSEDQLENTIRDFPALSSAERYKSHQALLEASAPEAVVICSPHKFHFQQIMDSLEAGSHVLTEKPMVCSIDHARRVMEKEDSTGRTVAIAYQRHCGGQFQYIRNSIQHGHAGEVRYLTAFQAQDWLHLTSGTWRQNMELSCGGQLNDSGSHLIDIILWMTGLSIEQVSASVDNCGTEVDINSALELTFTNGALGTLSVVGDYPSSGMYEDITIICENRAFFLRNGELTVRTGRDGERHRVDQFEYDVGSPTDNFVDSLRGDAEILAPSLCGLRTIQLTEAAWQSADTGRPVKV